ncbi:low affinity immunoglobulin gamma Fc region receptor II-a-like [Larimichthys crocea]|uniref:low affinity immunoglobulin gamma Fc region receptor II-a-like n=1 Tax=Larimichthys crocea TaxID=215358 RepID=UPI000F5EC4C4|nr:low affinity immunoglobulin gamma Fc region receptor II-a-like [Larimichthys crocea]
MEVRALCIRLLMDVLMLLVEPVHPNHTQESGFAQIIPTRLQLFEYTFVSFNCEGLRAPSGWTVMRNTNSKVSECVSTWKTATGSICAIKPAYQTDSGEYWCEAGGERSNAVNITVTAGSVILESPAVPVTEGAAVTLRCRSKRISSTHIADFYKDGLFIGSSFTGEKIIQHVSKSDEGLYKCSISDSGESAESRLAVRELHRETSPSPHHPDTECHTYLIMRTVFTVLLVALLLVVVGQLHCGKVRVTQKYVCICKVCKGSCQSDRSEKVNDKEC